MCMREKALLKIAKENGKGRHNKQWESGNEDKPGFAYLRHEVQGEGGEEHGKIVLTM